MILDLLADGSLTLTAVCLLAPHLTPGNHRDVLGAACHKSKREVEILVARMRPQPPIPSSVRKVPVRQPAEDRSASARRDDDALLVPRAEAAGGARKSTRPSPLHRREIRRPSSRRLRPSGTRCSSRSPVLLTKALPRARVDAAQAAKWRSRRDLRSGADTARRRPGEDQVRGDRATSHAAIDSGRFAPHSGGWSKGTSGSAMGDSALSSARTAAVPNEASSSSTILSHTPTAAKPSPPTSNSGAGRTTRTKRNSDSDRFSFAKTMPVTRHQRLGPDRVGLMAQHSPPLAGCSGCQTEKARPRARP